MDGIRFLVTWVIGMASIVGLFALPIAVGKKTGKTLVGVVLYVVELALLMYATRHFHMGIPELLMKPLLALVLWAMTIFFPASKGRPSNDPISKAMRRKQMKEYHANAEKHQKEEAAKEKNLAEAEAAELAEEESLDFLEDYDFRPSYTFLVSENDPGEEADRLFSQAKRGDPVKILYDKAREQYYLKFPFMDYYEHKLKERDYEIAKDRLLFVSDSGSGTVGIKVKRFLQIAAFDPREQEIKFYEIVGEKDPCDRVIGSTHLKDIGRVSAGKENRLLKEAKKWTLKYHIKGERKEKDADGKEVIYTLDHKMKIWDPEKAGVVVKENHFYGFIVYPRDLSGLFTDTHAHTEGEDVGLVLRYGIKDGITEIHNEKAHIPTKDSEVYEVFDTIFSYILERETE